MVAKRALASSRTKNAMTQIIIIEKRHAAKYPICSMGLLGWLSEIKKLVFLLFIRPTSRQMHCF
jgi:hypothetical protein